MTLRRGTVQSCTHNVEHAGRLCAHAWGGVLCSHDRVQD